MHVFLSLRELYKGGGGFVNYRNLSHKDHKMHGDGKDLLEEISLRITNSSASNGSDDIFLLLGTVTTNNII